MRKPEKFGMMRGKSPFGDNEAGVCVKKGKPIKTINFEVYFVWSD